MLALALVLVFSVTRVIFIPQGEFVAYGALTLVVLQTQKLPATCYLLMVMGVGCFVAEVASIVRHPARYHQVGRLLAVLAGKYLIFPVAVWAQTQAVFAQTLPMIAQIALTLLIVVPMGPFVYRLAYEPIAEASTLLFLIVAVAVHFATVGLGLVIFGAEGSRTTAFSDATFSFGSVSISGQSLWVVGTAVVLIAALYFYFDRTISGKALRATSVNRLGARLAFMLAAGLGALCGVLVVPITTIYYDSGFLIGLKGFVGAIVGGFVSYPLAAAGSILVGLLESYSLFWASAYKEVIVFTLIIRCCSGGVSPVRIPMKTRSNGDEIPATSSIFLDLPADRLRLAGSAGRTRRAGVLDHAAELHWPVFDRGHRARVADGHRRDDELRAGCVRRRRRVCDCVPHDAIRDVARLGWR